MDTETEREIQGKRERKENRRTENERTTKSREEKRKAERKREEVGLFYIIQLSGASILIGANPYLWVF